MFTTYRRRWQLFRVVPGDGSPLQDFRLWQILTRSVFALELHGHTFEVDVRHSADSTAKRSPVSLYRDGVQVARASLPATFTVPGGVVEVATSQYGLERIHYVTDDGAEHVLRPDPRTQEGLRARFAERFPRISAVIGVVAVVVFLAAGAVALLQGIDTITHSPVIAQHVGTFTSPIRLGTGGTIAVGLAGALAASERALSFRSRWLIGR